MEERLQKILSQWGVASRRQAEAMILTGRVRLNGKLVILGQKADPEGDQIEVDGRLIQPLARPTLVYFLLNKPTGVVSTCYDPQGRPTVMDLLPPSQECQGIHPVGRLDADSTGALLLTNDGDLTFSLTHPRHGIPKTYEVWVESSPSESVLQRWRQGLVLEGRKTQPAEVRVIEQGASQTCLEIIMKEGRNRQIRRIALTLGHPVIKLHRTAIGPIQLHLPERLSPRDCRPLKDFELRFLRQYQQHIY